jgi:predicted N-acetyltransferase YhbS
MERRTFSSCPHKDEKLIRIAPLSTADPAEIEMLLDAAFGKDRKARTAYRLREGMPQIEALSFAAFDQHDTLVGSIQIWPVALESAGGARAPMILVGPVAVSPDAQRSGIGKLLMKATMEAAANRGNDALIMIGDPEYYDRFFGFSAAATQCWDLPGPFERHRLLARIDRPGGLPAAGRVIPDPAFARHTTNA